MRNKLLQEELLKFFNEKPALTDSLNGVSATGGIGQINEALRILDFSQHARFLAYELLPERCFNEPEVIKAAAQKLYDGIERAKELLAILEKHYGEVKKKPCGGSFSCCAPCACESSAPCSPRRPQ